MRRMNRRWRVLKYQDGHRLFVSWYGPKFLTWREAYDYADRWTRGEYQSAYVLAGER